MFHSIYSRRAYKGDGVGGWIVYKTGSDARITGSLRDDVSVALPLVLDATVTSDLELRVRKNAYYECLEAVLTKPEPRWQDEQHIQVIGEDITTLVLEAWVLYFRFFQGVEDWIREADELETQNLPPSGRQTNFDASSFDEPQF